MIIPLSQSHAAGRFLRDNPDTQHSREVKKSMRAKVKLCGQWTDDCFGAKNYDGDILRVFAVYRPAGGNLYMLFDPRHPELGEHRHDDGSKPGAACSLIIGNGDEEKLVLSTSERFEGETFEDVAAQVEAWAQDQMERAVTALRAAFASPDPSGK
jgi:hypothetical protein